MDEEARKLEIALAEFGIAATVTEAVDGPSASTFYIELAKGERAAKVITLTEDIALAMQVRSCRVYIDRDKGSIGIELSKSIRNLFAFREILKEIEADASEQFLPLAIGRVAGGKIVVADLAAMPHLLIAGATGSGKSVALHSIIVSLMTQKSATEVRLILIDPKCVEFPIYNGVPHLLCPVITRAEGAVSALRWALDEMNKRYQQLQAAKVRNIETFNAGADEPMARVVVVIDELADLMAVSGGEVEGMLQRLAQMGRGAGLHLVIATQRPSVDVITGTIKANFPTRMSFHLTSKVDSRTILGRQGAEWLLGSGDMLFSNQGRDCIRMQSPFVSEEFSREITCRFQYVEHEELCELNLEDRHYGDVAILSAIKNMVDSSPQRQWIGSPTKLAEITAKLTGIPIGGVALGILLRRSKKWMKRESLVMTNRKSGDRKYILSTNINSLAAKDSEAYGREHKAFPQ